MGPPPPPHLENRIVEAVRASHRDAGIARMLPVFLWRMRAHVDLEKLVRMNLPCESFASYFDKTARL
jgi:hypothetical protein